MFNVCDEQSSFWTSFSLSSVTGWGLGGLCEDAFRGPLADEVCCGWVDRQPRASVTLSGHVVCSHTRSRQGQLPLSPLMAWFPHSLLQTHNTHLPVIPSHQQHTRPSSLPRVARSLAPHPIQSSRWHALPDWLRNPVQTALTVWVSAGVFFFFLQKHHVIFLAMSTGREADRHLTAWGDEWRTWCPGTGKLEGTGSKRWPIEKIEGIC